MFCVFNIDTQYSKFMIQEQKIFKNNNYTSKISKTKKDLTWQNNTHTCTCMCIQACRIEDICKLVIKHEHHHERLITGKTRWTRLSPRMLSCCNNSYKSHFTLSLGQLRHSLSLGTQATHSTELLGELMLHIVLSCRELRVPGHSTELPGTHSTIQWMIWVT